jgi:hypothetical protein
MVHTAMRSGSAVIGTFHIAVFPPGSIGTLFDCLYNDHIGPAFTALTDSPQIIP